MSDLELKQEINELYRCRRDLSMGDCARIVKQRREDAPIRRRARIEAEERIAAEERNVMAGWRDRCIRLHGYFPVVCGGRGPKDR